MNSSRSKLTGVILALILFLLAACSGEGSIPDQTMRPTGELPPPTVPMTMAATPLPISLPDPLVIADFENNCSGGNMTNNLGGGMGAAYNAPDSLQEAYIVEPGRGCVAQIEYEIKEWAAFWMKLQGEDFSPYADGNLTFDIKAEPGPNMPSELKIELKRLGDQIGILYVSGITKDWQTIQAPLSKLHSPGFGRPISGWSEMAELVFTFEFNHSGSQGTVYLDDIILNPR